MRFFSKQQKSIDKLTFGAGFSLASGVGFSSFLGAAGEAVEVADLSSITNIFQIILDAIGALLMNVLFMICKLVFNIIDVMQILINRMAGIGDYNSKAIDLNNPVFRFILNETVLTAFVAVLGVSLVILIIFSIIAILKNELETVEDTKGDANNKKKILFRTIKSGMLFIATPVIFIAAVIFTNTLLTSFNNALRVDNTRVTLGGQMFTASAYDANKYRRYAEQNQRVPILIDFDDPYDNGTYSLYNPEQLVGIYDAWTDGKGIYRMFAYASFPDFKKSLSYYYKNGKIYLHNSYSYSGYEKFISTAEQYQVMADFIDYAVQNGLEFVFKNSSDNDIDWSALTESGVYNREEGTFTISYKDSNDIIPGLNYYNIAYNKGNGGVATPLYDAILTLANILGISDLIDFTEEYSGVTDDIKYEDMRYLEGQNFRILERTEGSQNIINWKTEKTLYSGALYNTYILTKKVYNTGSHTTEITGQYYVFENGGKYYRVKSGEGTAANGDPYKYEPITSGSGDELIEVMYENNGLRLRDTVEPVFVYTTWPEKLYNDLSVIYYQMDITNNIIADTWSIALGQFVENVNSVTSGADFNTTIIHPFGLILSELFLGNIKNTDDAGDSVPLSASSMYVTSTVQSIVRSLVGENKYMETMRQIEFFTEMFNSMMSPVLEQIAVYEGIDISDPYNISETFYTYKAYLASILIGKDCSNYLIDSVKTVTELSFLIDSVFSESGTAISYNNLPDFVKTTVLKILNFWQQKQSEDGINYEELEVLNAYIANLSINGIEMTDILAATMPDYSDFVDISKNKNGYIQIINKGGPLSEDEEKQKEAAIEYLAKYYKYQIRYAIRTYTGTAVSAGFDIVLNGHTYKVSPSITTARLTEYILGNALNNVNLLNKIEAHVSYESLNTFEKYSIDKIASLETGDRRQLLVNYKANFSLTEGEFDEIHEIISQRTSQNNLVYVESEYGGIYDNAGTSWGLLKVFLKDFGNLCFTVNGQTNLKNLSPNASSSISGTLFFNQFIIYLKNLISDKIGFNLSSVDEIKEISEGKIEAFNALSSEAKEAINIIYNFYKDMSENEDGEFTEATVQKAITFVEVIDQYKVSHDDFHEYSRRFNGKETSYIDILFVAINEFLVTSSGGLYTEDIKVGDVKTGTWFSSLDLKYQMFSGFVKDYYEQIVIAHNENIENVLTALTLFNQFVTNTSGITDIGDYDDIDSLVIQENSLLYEYIKKYVKTLELTKELAIGTIDLANEGLDFYQTIFDMQRLLPGFNITFNPGAGSAETVFKVGAITLGDYINTLLADDEFMADDYATNLIHKLQAINDLGGFYIYYTNEKAILTDANYMVSVYDGSVPIKVSDIVRDIDKLARFINGSIGFDTNIKDILVFNVDLYNIYTYITYLGLDFSTEFTLKDYRIQAIKNLLNFEYRAAESEKETTERFLSTLTLFVSDFEEVDGEKIIKVDQPTKAAIMNLAGVPNRPDEELVYLSYSSQFNDSIADEADGDVFIICWYDEENDRYVPYLMSNKRDSTKHDSRSYTTYTDYYYNPENNNKVKWYPIVAKGLFTTDNLPTAIRQNSGNIEFYRNNVIRVDVSTLNIGVYYQTIEDIQLKETIISKVVNFFTKTFTGKSLAERIVESIPRMYVDANLHVPYGTSTYVAYHVQQGNVILNYNFDETIGISVHNLYSVKDLNVIVLLFGTILMFGAIFKAIWGLIQRIYDLTILFIISPSAIATIPLNSDDKDTMFTRWRQKVVSKMLSVYGIIIGLNVFFILVPIIADLDFFTEGSAAVRAINEIGLFTGRSLNFLNSITRIIFMLAAISMIQTAPGFIGAIIDSKNKEDIFSEGERVKQRAKAAINTTKDLVSGQYALDKYQILKSNVKQMVPGSALISDMHEKAVQIKNKAAAKTAELALRSYGVPPDVAKNASKALEDSMNTVRLSKKKLEEKRTKEAEDREKDRAKASVLDFSYADYTVAQEKFDKEAKKAKAKAKAKKKK